MSDLVLNWDPQDLTREILSFKRQAKSGSLKARDVDWKRKPEYTTMSRTRISAFRARAGAVLSRK